MHRAKPGRNLKIEHDAFCVSPAVRKKRKGAVLFPRSEIAFTRRAASIKGRFVYPGDSWRKKGANVK